MPAPKPKGAVVRCLGPITPEHTFTNDGTLGNRLCPACQRRLDGMRLSPQCQKPQKGHDSMEDEERR